MSKINIEVFKISILLSIIAIFCHLIADYNLQGILAQFKQKSWWKVNAPDEKYKYDYIVALISHCFVWSFMVHLPFMVYGLFNHSFGFWPYLISFIVHIAIHAYIDDLKANKLKINLCQDQFAHFVQIILIAANFTMY